MKSLNGLLNSWLGRGAWVLLCAIAFALPARAGNGVYVVTNPNGANAVEAYRRNIKTGLLTYVGRFDTGGRGLAEIGGAQSHALVATRTHLFVVNPGSNDFSTFVLRNDGSLLFMGVTSSGGTRPVSIAVYRNVIYVLNQGQLGVAPASCNGFTIGDAELPVSIGTYDITYEAEDIPTDVFFTAHGARLVVLLNGSDAIDTFSVTPDGALTLNRRLTGVNNPVGGAMSPVQPFVAFAALDDDTSPRMISMRATGFALPSIVSSAGLASTISPCWAAATPNGKKVWSSNFAPGSLTLFSGKLNGSIQAVSSYMPASSSPGSLDIAVDQRGKFLYRLRAFNPSGGAAPVPVVETLQITNSTANGGLQLVQTVSLPADLQTASPTGIVVTAP
ncbi:MAG: hypothetical protein NT059_10845 [Planctomycetota bacterium]|nr:hypothetical protein [Planctomycetota bacterium]